MRETMMIFCAMLIANEVGLGRMNPWIGMFAVAVIGVEAARHLVRSGGRK